MISLSNCGIIPSLQSILNRWNINTTKENIRIGFLAAKLNTKILLETWQILREFAFFQL